MSRLVATFVRDWRLLYRNKFLHAAVVIVLATAGLMILLPLEIRLWLAPLVLFTNFAMNGFYFLAAAVLLERAESSLEVHRVTPLTIAEYLLAKVLTVCLITLFETVLIAVLVYGGHINYLLLAISTVASSAVFAVWAFVMVLNYRSISEFLPPSILVVLFMTVPVFGYFGWPATWLFAFPLFGGFDLAVMLVEPYSATRVLFDVLASVAWIGLGALIGVRRFDRHAVAR